MKSLFLILFLFFVQQLSIAQPENVSVSSIEGRWDVLFDEQCSTISEDLLKRAESERVRPLDNHNIAIYNFGPNGEFSLGSIQDYAAGDEEGTFSLSKDGKSIYREVLMPNWFTAHERTHLQKKKSKILYLKGDILVLKTKKDVLYMKRTNRSE